jgi:hypothetical protein
MNQPPPGFSLTDALSPFSAEEVARLERYVKRATELKDSRFFQQSATFTMNFTDEGMSFDLPRGEDEEHVTTMVTRLRNLHEEGARERPASGGRSACCEATRSEAVRVRAGSGRFSTTARRRFAR